MSTKKKTINDISDKKISAAVKKSISWSGVRRNLGGHGTFRAIKKRVTTLGIDISHMRGRSWARKVGPAFIYEAPMDQVLVKDSFYSSPRLMKRIISKGIKPPICSRCGMTKWQGHPIPLLLKCKNGSGTDLRLENLAFMCHNCDALPDNPPKYAAYRYGPTHDHGMAGRKE
jgi:hypothetical protein